VTAPQPTYVIGHQNPDTDTICSAIAYAALRNRQGDTHTVAARQGAVRSDTAYVLERFGIPPPLLLRDAYLRVSEVMTTPVSSLPSTASIIDVAALLRLGEMLAVPLTDGEGSLAGVVTQGDLGRFVFDGLDPDVSENIPIELHNVLAALGGTLVHEARERTLRDRVTVGAMSVESIRSRVQRDQLLVLGDREDAQCAAIEAGVGALIITGGYPVTEQVIQLAKQHDVTIISVEHHTFSTVRLLNMSIPASYVMNREPITCSPDDRVIDVRALLATFPVLPVIDDTTRPIGLLYRSDLLKPVRRRVVLVDHNERGQSLPGLEEADVVAIIDHHRVADVVTANPILFRAEPVGCTCTIIAGLYSEAGMSIPPDIAGIMLAAIVSDTVLFRSPTCTPRDRSIAAMLEERSGVAAVDLADAMFTRASDLAGRKPRDILEADFKEYVVGSQRYGIGALELTSLNVIDPLLPEVRATMEQLQRDRGYTSLMFAVVDVVHARSRIYVVGREQAIADALGRELRHGWHIDVDRVVSRKKDIVPILNHVV